MRFVKLFGAVLLISATLQLSAYRSNLINDLNKSLTKEDREVFQTLIILHLKMLRIELDNQFKDNLTIEDRKKLEVEYSNAAKTRDTLVKTRSDLSRNALETAALKLAKELVEQKISLCESILNDFKLQNNDK